MFGDTWAFASGIVVLAQVRSTSSHRIIRDFSARLRGFLLIIMQQPADEMTANGMNISADERAKILAYLSTYLGPAPPKATTAR
jgi:hypothetical protein